MVPFLVHHAHLVLHAETAFHVVDFDRDVGADLSLHHEARVIGKRRRRPQARLGTAFRIILFAITLQADIHRTLEHEFRLVESEVSHPSGHRHGNRNVEHGARLRRLVAFVSLADETVQPEVLAAHVIHVGHVIRKLRIVRRP